MMFSPWLSSMILYSVCFVLLSCSLMLFSLIPSWDSLRGCDMRFYFGIVTANTIPGFTRNSPPLWARGQDAFLVIYGVRVQAHLVYSVELCKGSAVLSSVVLYFSGGLSFKHRPLVLICPLNYSSELLCGVIL